MLLTMANRKDKCFSLFFFPIVVWFLCSKGDDDSHENLIDWGNLFEFPQLVFVLWCWCYIQWAFDANGIVLFNIIIICLAVSSDTAFGAGVLFGVVGRIQDNSARFDPALGEKKTAIENMESSRCEGWVKQIEAPKPCSSNSSTEQGFIKIEHFANQEWEKKVAIASHCNMAAWCHKYSHSHEARQTGNEQGDDGKWTTRSK